MSVPLPTVNRGLTAPAAGAFAITPSDSSDLPVPARALYVGGEGDVEVRMLDGSTVTFANVGTGSILPVSATRVLQSGTTATYLLGLV
ncbi:spike base protein, RCAP_Rcc01079 family [Acuticoccus sp.]|uniref:spike base protein, RCAP_Rcc01079 family n=1 Tax=Acuticoccus sp. TaxID=1904378 RepID=UPI003B526E37